MNPNELVKKRPAACFSFIFIRSVFEKIIIFYTSILNKVNISYFNFKINNILAIGDS